MYNTKTRGANSGRVTTRNQTVYRQKEGRYSNGYIPGKDNSSRSIPQVRFIVTPAAIEEWMKEVRRGMENQLRARYRDIAAQYEEKIKEMKTVIGELTLENIALKKYDALFGDEKK